MSRITFRISRLPHLVRFILILLPCLALSQIRMIPHLTKDGGTFSTQIIIRNLSTEQGVVELTPYAQNGIQFASVTEILAANEVVYTSSLSLFGTSAISHFTISGEESVKVTVNYEEVYGTGSPVHIHETGIQSDAWMIYPGNWDAIWDGLAITNPNSMSTAVSINQRDSDGVVNRTIMLDNVRGFSKALYILSADFNPVENSVFEIISDLPISITALQGDYSQKYLWENTPVPIAAPVVGTTTKEFRLADTQVYVKMIWIPANQFEMGRPGTQDAGEDESPRHQVEFSSGYWLGKFEVTQTEWETIMGPWSFCAIDPDRPANMLNWYDTQEFVDRLNELDPDRPWRLPSEAEWENASRSGVSDTRFWWGDDPSYQNLPGYAWFIENSFTRTHDVGTTDAGEPNPFGFWDMHGNVSEWCEDWYHFGYEDAPTDGSAWNQPGDDKVIRGGSAWHSAAECLPNKRAFYSPTGSDCSIGLRLARDY